MYFTHYFQLQYVHQEFYRLSSFSLIYTKRAKRNIFVLFFFFNSHLLENVFGKEFFLGIFGLGENCL